MKVNTEVITIKITVFNVIDENLNLQRTLRIVMSRDPNELKILGQQSVDTATAKLFWKFFVLQKYGGFHMERNILLQHKIHNLRKTNITLLKLTNSSSVSNGVYLISAPNQKDIRKLVNVFQVHNFCLKMS